MQDLVKDRLAHLSAEKRALLALRLSRSQGGSIVAAAPSELRPDRIARHEPFPLKDLQQAYWVGRNQGFTLGGVAGHSYYEIDLRGVDVPHIAAAWNRLIERHDMLRAVIHPDGRQQVLEQLPPYEIAEIDLRGLAPEEVVCRLAELRATMSHQVLPSDRWPLFEIRAVRLTAERVRLFISLDALFIDGWSMALLFREWRQLLHDPAAVLAPLDLSFRDYVLAEKEREQSDAHRKAEEYWHARLATLPPAPELPLACNPEAVTQPWFVRRYAELDADRWRRLKERAAQAGLTPTGVLLTCYAGVLAVWSKSQTFTLNVPQFNRLPLHPQVNDLVGEFASFTLLAVHHDCKETFEDRARRLQDRLWADLNHSDFGGVEVLRELARLYGETAAAMMPVIFTSAPEDPRQKDTTLLSELERFGEVVFSINQTPQVWLDNHVFDHAGRLVVHWDTVDALFPEGLPQTLLDAFVGHVQRLADEEAAWHEPWQQTAHLLIPADDLALEEAANGLEVPIPEVLVQELFERRAAMQPDRLAVQSSRRTLSYSQLLRLARQWGRYLHSLGIDGHRPIAVVMEKGWEQVVAALGSLMGGAPYLPLDAAQPQERLWQILQQCHVEIGLTQSWLAKEKTWPQDVRWIAVDQEDVLAGVDDGPLPAMQKPDDLAYVLFTSGSTGVPKGVMIAHRGVVNALEQTRQKFQIGPVDRVLALTALHHDMSLFDLFGVLAAGGCIVLPEAWGARDPAHWLDLLTQEGVTVWNSVPAMMEMLLEYTAGRQDMALSRLRLAFLGGDWIPVTLPERLRALAPSVRIVSVGGPTETTLWNIWYEVGTVDPSWKSIPYGRPIANTRYHILNEALETCPTGVAGEMYCAGVGLARGYWHDEGLTQARFIMHPRTGERLYRTGDLGRRLPDGDLEFLGRADLQVKIHGQRIELGEVETAIRRFPGVRAAVASAFPDAPHKPRLVAHIVADAAALSPEQLRAYLGERLSAHMVPTAFVFLDSLPLTPNGKVNRKALPPPSEGAAEMAVSAAIAARPALARVLEIVAATLKLPAVDPESSLLGYGATSIDLVRISNQLEEAFGRRPRMDQIFRLQTASAIARFYEEQEETRAADGPLQAVAGTALQRYLASFKVLSDPAEREAFKDSRPGLRHDDWVRDRIVLVQPQETADRRRQYDGRRSYRNFSLKPIPFGSFSRFLSCLQPLTLHGKPKYMYASPGGLYPTQVYLHMKAGRVEGLRAGVYYYHPAEHGLALLTPDVEIDRGIHVPFVNTPTFDQAAFSIFLIAQMRAIAPSYGELSLHFVTLEAGVMAHLLETTAPECGIGLCQIGSVQFEPIRPWFHLDEGHMLIHSLVGGRLDHPATGEAPAADQQGASNPLAQMLRRVKQLSAEEARALLDANRGRAGAIEPPQ